MVRTSFSKAAERAWVGKAGPTGIPAYIRRSHPKCRVAVIDAVSSIADIHPPI